MSHCMYSATGEMLCSDKPMYIDRTGMMRKKPFGTLFWDTVPNPKMDPACFNVDMPCCEDNKTYFCRPKKCCAGNISEQK